MLVNIISFFIYFIRGLKVMLDRDLAELFGVKIPAISKHLANIFETDELQKEATVSVLEKVQMEG